MEWLLVIGFSIMIKYLGNEFLKGIGLFRIEYIVYYVREMYNDRVGRYLVIMYL